ncbi:MAG: maleylacetoacetate isomerase [Gammaproteobacteria bacterium]
MQLFTYFRSTAAYRVRIALNIKRREAEQHFVNLVKDGGDQHKPSFRKLNPQGLIPVLVSDGIAISQSLAIIEYLEEVQPNPPLLPSNPLDRAWVRGLAMAVACDIHPLNNLRVLKYLENEISVNEETKLTWYRNWVAQGFAGLEETLANDPRKGKFCYGDAPGLADIFLVPQVFNANRFDCDMTSYPTLQQINATCLTLPEFQQAAPEQQPDAI